MLKKRLAVAASIGLAAVMLASCGNDKASKTPPKVGNGALYVLLTDVPSCDVLSLRARVSKINIGAVEEEEPVKVLDPNTMYPIQVNFATLRDFSTVLVLTSVPAVTYERIDITLSWAELGLYDPAESPPSSSIFAELSQTEVNVPIEPPLVVTEGKVSVLRLDFDLARSIEVGEDWQVTGKVTPVFSATPVAPIEGTGFGDLHNLMGFIRNVSPFSTGTGFTGSFGLQLLAGTGPFITVNLTEDTELFGAPALNQVETGRFVEVEALLDETGNVVAKLVEVQERAVVEESKVAFLGYVTSVTRDEDGSLTQFGFHVRQEEPPVSSAVPLDSGVAVNVAPTTEFQFSSRATNFANLTFDQSAVAPGQELIVHGKFTLQTDEPTTVDASKIYLKLQTAQGTFFSLVQVGSDGRSGAFWLAPCCVLFQGNSVLAFTTNETAFLNMFGLADLQPQRTLLVMGLPFYLPDGGTINDIAIPPNTLVLLAKQVHQLD